MGAVDRGHAAAAHEAWSVVAVGKDAGAGKLTYLALMSRADAAATAVQTIFTYDYRDLDSDIDTSPDVVESPPVTTFK